MKQNQKEECDVVGEEESSTDAIVQKEVKRRKEMLPIAKRFLIVKRFQKRPARTELRRSPRKASLDRDAAGPCELARVPQPPRSKAWSY